MLGTVTNVATVTAPAGVTELDVSNNLAADTTDVVAVADLHGRLTDSRCWVQPGETTTYTVEVFNDGPSDTFNNLVDVFGPLFLNSVTWTCTPTGGATCQASGTGEIFTTVDLPAGSSVVFSMTGTVDAGAAGWLITNGSTSALPGVTDPTPGDTIWVDIDALEPPVFCDDFDTGTTGGWTATVP